MWADPEKAEVEAQQSAVVQSLSVVWIVRIPRLLPRLFLRLPFVDKASQAGGWEAEASRQARTGANLRLRGYSGSEKLSPPHEFIWIYLHLWWFIHIYMDLCWFGLDLDWFIETRSGFMWIWIDLDELMIVIIVFTHFCVCSTCLVCSFEERYFICLMSHLLIGDV